MNFDQQRELRMKDAEGRQGWGEHPVSIWE